MSLNNSFAYGKNGDGKYLSTIDFDINDKLTTETIRNNYSRIIVGELSIGDHSYRLNIEEIEHLIDTLQRSKDVLMKKYTMNIV